MQNSIIRMDRWWLQTQKKSRKKIRSDATYPRITQCMGMRYRQKQEDMQYSSTTDQIYSIGRGDAGKVREHSVGQWNMSEGEEEEVRVDESRHLLGIVEMGEHPSPVLPPATALPPRGHQRRRGRRRERGRSVGFADDIRTAPSPCSRSRSRSWGVR